MVSKKGTMELDIQVIEIYGEIVNYFHQYWNEGLDRDAQHTASGPDPAPERVISGPRSRLRIKETSELLPILQRITVGNSPIVATMSNCKH